MSIDDRIRAATQAVADTVREVPPLELPADVSGARPRRRRSRRGPAARPGSPSRRGPAVSRGQAGWTGWSGFLVPVAAALAVIAVAAILAAVRHDPGAPAVPAPAVPATHVPGYTSAGPALKAGEIPRYGALINEGANRQLSNLSVVDSGSGQVVTAFNPPAGQGFNGVAAAADGETFVADAGPRTSASPYAGPHTEYLLRVTRGLHASASLVRLPVLGLTSVGEVIGLALSPDGRTLAVMFVQAPGAAQQPEVTLLRTYSVVTGQLLRAWTGPSPGTIIGNAGEDNQAGLSWLANGRELAFTGPGSTVRVLDTTRAGTSLLAASRPVFALSQAPAYCRQALLTPDGKTVLCASDPQTDDVCGPGPGLEFAAYSVATGKFERDLYHFAGKCNTFSTAQLLWAGSATSAIVLLQAGYLDTAGFDNTRIVGLVTPGELHPFHFPAVPGGSAPGSIAF